MFCDLKPGDFSAIAIFGTLSAKHSKNSKNVAKKPEKMRNMQIISGRKKQKKKNEKSGRLALSGMALGNRQLLRPTPTKSTFCAFSLRKSGFTKLRLLWALCFPYFHGKIVTKAKFSIFVG